MSSRFLTVFMLFAVSAPAFAEDWPTYRHDMRRSGITSEELRPPLSPVWVYHPLHKPSPAWEPPRSVPVEGYLELPRVRFDDAYHVVAAGDAIYFGSSSDNKVYCMEAATGKLRWQFFTSGPVRLAPTVWQGKVYFGSDDGVVYCLSARDGKVVWKYPMSLRDRRLLGRGKMVSMWPVRTGVLVDKGVAYAGAGIFPQEGVYFVALDAATGKRLWLNDTGGEATESRVSPQGYLLATDKLLFAPLGRVSPMQIDRATGRLGAAAYFGKNIGGTDALIFGDKLYTGTEEVMAYTGRTRGRYAWFKARKVLVTEHMTYGLSGKEMAAFKRDTYPKASVRRFLLRDQRMRLRQTMRGPERNRRNVARLVDADNKRLEAIDKQLAELQGDPKKLDALKTERVKVDKSLRANLLKLAAAEKALAPLLERKKKLEQNWEAAGLVMDQSTGWRRPSDCTEFLIMAGRILFAGGDGKVQAVDSTDGKLLWEAPVDGKARGLTVANGRLYVSTDTGAIHCFGAQGSELIGAIEQPETDEPFPKDKLSRLCAEAADTIVRESGVKRGFALVLGVGTGRLAYELAKRTNLVIYAIDPNAQKVQAAREALDRAGVYGDRVVVDRGPLDKLPYSDYFANLVVSEKALVSGLGGMSAKEVLRVLKPCGGVAMIGQPEGGSGLSKQKLASWLPKGRITTRGGLWTKYERGPLPGADNWTGEYGNPGNTASSNDQLVKGPLGMLWFGDPGPLQMISRHRRQAAPLAVNGVLFVQGENKVNAYDAYNGLKLWDRDFPRVVRAGVSHDASNLAADDRSFYVVWQNKCYRLDAKTGKELAVFSLPKSPDGRPRRWGYVACDKGILFGSASLYARVSDILFAYDVRRKKLLWTHRGGTIDHPTISVGEGRVFFIDRSVSASQRRQALKDAGFKGDELKQKERTAPVRMVTALSAKTGRKAWEKPWELTGCIGGVYWSSLATMYNDGVLTIFGVYTDAHHWKDFFAGTFKTRRVIAVSSKSGKKLWDKRIGYRVRPLIIGDTFHAEPWAYDLKTGKQRTRVNPITGRTEPWQWTRPGHHCGAPAGCPGMLLARSYYMAYYDLKREAGVTHLGAQRTGCWINFIPAEGLLLVPEASSACMCPFPIQCTIVLKHVEQNRGWGKYSTWNPGVLPVKRLNVNLGAPGDRLAKDDKLWLSFPRRATRLVLGFKVGVRTYPGGGFFKHSTDFVHVAGTDAPWIYTSGIKGVRRLKIPVLAPGDGKAAYTVRLHFAELDNVEPGKRVFNVAVNGRPALKGVDIVKEARGVRKALVKEIKSVEAEEAIQIDFSAKIGRPAPDQMPLIQGVEIERTEILTIGFTPPQFSLNDMKPEQTGAVRISNIKNVPFSGSLFVKAPRGFSVKPSKTRLKIEAGGKAQIALVAKVLRKTKRGMYPMTLKLVRTNGKVECEKKVDIEYLADHGRVVLKAVADAYVGPRVGGRGNSPNLLVDGGNARMGDESHHLTLLRFKLDVPGKPLSVMLRIRNFGNPTSNGGNVCLTTDPWQEMTVKYANRPKPGKVLGNIGRVTENAVLEVPLKLSLEGMKELNLVIDPINTDGTDYCSRESGKPAELVIEYGK